MKSIRDAEDIVRRKLHVKAGPAVREQLLAHVRRAAEQSTEPTPALDEPMIGRTIMRSPITKLAVAAVIIVAVVLGLFEWLGGDSPSGVVWAEVANKLDASVGMTSYIRYTTTQPGLDDPIEFEGKIYVSSRYGYRMDSYQGDDQPIVSICNNAERRMITLMHSDRQYVVEDVPEEDWAEVAQAQGGAMDPKSIVTELLSGDYTELGRKMIDGVEVEGVEIHNPPGGRANFEIDRCVMQLWVSVETGYPVRMNTEVVGNNGSIHVTHVVDQFRWNVELDAELFETTIPPDYAEMQMP